MNTAMKTLICVAGTVVATVAMVAAVINFIGPYPAITMLCGMTIGCVGMIAWMAWTNAPD